MNKVQGSTHLYKTTNGSVVNTDNEQYLAFKRQYEIATKKNQQIDNMMDTINELKERLDQYENIK